MIGLCGSWEGRGSRGKGSGEEGEEGSLLVVFYYFGYIYGGLGVGVRCYYVKGYRIEEVIF